MNSPQDFARAILNSRHHGFLIDSRDELYDNIEDNRAATVYENEIVRPSIQANIKRVGAAIEIARSTGASEDVIETLIEQVQMFNRMRHTNRLAVKELAFEQAINKAMLAEISRDISYIEADIEIDELVLGAGESEFVDDADLGPLEACFMCDTSR
jgi:hypothetical protein